jgi:hypothetical protein
MPEPGSKAYDKKRARLRADYDNKGVPDGKANDRANAVLQGDISPQEADPKPDRSADSGHAGRGREASK